MSDRRQFLTGALALAAAPAVPTPAAAQEDAGPQRLVRQFYRPGFDERAMPLSPALRRLFRAAKARSAKEEGVVAGLDFSWITFSQDSGDDIERTLVVKTVVQTAGNAVVEARFRDPGPRLIQYRVIKHDGRWVIDDILYPSAGQSLSKLLAEGAKGN